ncbi:MAG: GlsB/YeaQ/YmgE family stress response membrane protein [Brumimicrobium sp.]|nr:GlsB/YeaQ/YmgE family stress response membrane protein [Brumimicrobium sp.]
MQVLVSVILGAIAGWLASLIMKAKSGGLIINIVLGIVGSFVGKMLFDALNVKTGSGWLGSVITATVGAIVVIALIRWIVKSVTKKKS